MKTLPSGIATDAQAQQSSWAEIFDIYLKDTITTPFGSTNIIRITQCPGGINFFTPTQAPEPSGTRGDAAAYAEYNIQREGFKASTKDTNDKIKILASNVTGEWATMLADVDWYDVPIMVRKVDLDRLSSATNADFVPLFVGRIDSAIITLEQLQFSCSNGLATLQTTIPAEDMHVPCRARWADDLCEMQELAPENFRNIEVPDSGCTTTKILDVDRTEDNAVDGGAGVAVAADSTTEKITDPAHGMHDGDAVTFTAVAMPGGLSAGVIYYIRDKGTNDYKLATTQGGAAINIISNGTTVVRHQPYGADLVNALATGNITTSSFQAGNEGYKTQASNNGATPWKFALIGANPNPAVDIYSPYIQFDLGSDKQVRAITIVSGAQNDKDAYRLREFEIYAATSAASTVFYSVGTNAAPSFNRNTRTYTILLGSTIGYRHWRIVVKFKDKGPFLYDVTGTITMALSNAGTDLVDPLSNGNITTSLEVTGNEGYQVQSGLAGTWRVNNTLTEDDFNFSDWGVNDRGYWRIPDTQAGLTNERLEPWIEFDFTTAKAMKLWRLMPMAGAERNEMPRVCEIFSASYFEQSVTADAGTEKITLAAHGLSNGDTVIFYSAASPPSVPGGLTLGTTYYVVNSATNDFKVAATSGGSPINLTGPGSSVTLTANLKCERYLELPPRPGVTFDFMIPNAASRRFWRICVRNSWAESLNYTMFAQIQGFTGLRNYWANGGRIVFADNTATAELQGVSSPVLASYAGVLYVRALPAAPSSSDTYRLYRGCTREFNKCCELGNHGAYAGFTTMPTETVIR